MSEPSTAEAPPSPFPTDLPESLRSDSALVRDVVPAPTTAVRIINFGAPAEAKALFELAHSQDYHSALLRAWASTTPAVVPTAQHLVQIPPDATDFVFELIDWKGKWRAGRAHLLVNYIGLRLRDYVPYIWTSIVRNYGTSIFVEVPIQHVIMGAALDVFADFYDEAPIDSKHPDRKALNHLAKDAFMSYAKFHDVPHLRPAWTACRRLIRTLDNDGNKDKIKDITIVMWRCRDADTESTITDYGNCGCVPCRVMRTGDRRYRDAMETDEPGWKRIR